MQEQWVKWVPLEGIGRMYVDSLTESKDGLKLILKSDHKSAGIEFHFDCFVPSFRITDEGKMSKKLKFLTEVYGGNFYADWTFFIVKNSDYLNWLDDESYGLCQYNETVHYVFLTDDEIIDVLSKAPPIVTII